MMRICGLYRAVKQDTKVEKYNSNTSWYWEYIHFVGKRIKYVREHKKDFTEQRWIIESYNLIDDLDDKANVVLQ